MTTIQPSCFLEIRKGLLTGNETVLDMLLGGLMSDDIQQQIYEFIGEEPEYDCIYGTNTRDYIYFHEFSLPVDPDEKHCFDMVFDDDFALDEDMDVWQRRSLLRI